jgi:glycosyltransferase involved in cell wall biosynthesis
MAPFPIAINGRALGRLTSGVERYTRELSARLAADTRVIRPGGSGSGLAGHLWEQARLPLALGRGELLWSPANVGPLVVSHQVVTIHDVAPIDHPEWFRASFARWYRWLLPRLARRVRHVITVSRFSRDRIVATLGVSEDHVSVIPSGVDRRFTPDGPVLEPARRRRYGIDPGPYLLAVGSIEPRKNLARLVDAWGGLPAHVRRPDATTGGRGLALVLAGPVGRAFRPTALAHHAGVVMTGPVDDEDLPALYRGAEAVACVSLYEGFGLPALEAMACGTPVVASRTAAFREVVGDAAITVDPRDTDRIREGLSHVLERREVRTGLIARGAARAREFDWDVTAARTLKVLRDVQSGPRA